MDQGHLEDCRVGEASWQNPCLAQQPFNEQANVQSKRLMVGHQQQGPVQWNGPTAPLNSAICPG